MHASLTDAERTRAAGVRHMFGRIAGRYVLMNSLMTFGRDRAWRRLVVQAAALPRGGKLLDIATGPGDIALEALRADPTLNAVGADFSLAMMRAGQARPNGASIRWCGADALALPFPDEMFDAVTSGFLIRNLPGGRVVDVFVEQARVLKPGGRVICLDTSPPPDNALRPLVNFHFQRVIPALGALISGHRDAYTYLPDSTVAFKTPGELAASMREAGLRDVTYHRLMLGTVAIHIGRRA
jgi:demethylmenaquinone methyltransferase/2-methoxy-6-polyprenyl-1,4-benzoquinol methylase